MLGTPTPTFNGGFLIYWFTDLLEIFLNICLVYFSKPNGDGSRSKCNLTWIRIIKYADPTHCLADLMALVTLFSGPDRFGHTVQRTWWLWPTLLQISNEDCRNILRIMQCYSCYYDWPDVPPGDPTIPARGHHLITRPTSCPHHTAHSLHQGSTQYIQYICLLFSF